MPVPLLPVQPGHAVRTKALQPLCDESHAFFKHSRSHARCGSKRPSLTRIQTGGDFARSWWMKSFFDGTIDLSLQTDSQGCILLHRENANRVRELKNPLRDPLVVVKRDDQFSLKDGFHRLCEAMARGYRGRVWTVVLDMDADSEED